MDKYYDDTLPCLLAVGPWWTELDRRLLFCYLLMIFPINEEYLAELPAARYRDGLEDCVMNAHTIKNELQAFRKINGMKKCTCAGIRSLEFSFGKLNPRICYLCPYSGTYKNVRKSDERRFLYHIMTDGNRSLLNYLDLEQKKLEQTFFSYFPVFVENVLVEAYPFTFFAEWFLGKEAEDYKKDIEKAHKELLCKVYEDIQQRIPYLRIRALLEREWPLYREEMKKAADAELEALKQQNVAVRPINELMMIRLFRILTNNKKYVHKRPEDYITQDRALIVPDLFSKTLSMKEDGRNQEKETLRNPLSHFEDKSFQGLPNLDEITISGNKVQSLELFNNLDSDKKIETYEGTGDGKRENTLNLMKSETNKEPEQSTVQFGQTEENQLSEVKCVFKEFYIIEEGIIDPLFVYGENNQKKEGILLNAFIDDSVYFAMEPVEYHGITGLLIVNSESDYIFYSIERYGAKPIRSIADRGAEIYTSNNYMLGKYLLRSKVTKIIPHDVGFALSLNKDNIVASQGELYPLGIPERMKEYKKIYDDAYKSLGKREKEILKRFEEFILLVCADGNRPPISGLDSLCHINDNMEYEYLYKKDMKPIRDGVFVGIRASMKDIEIEDEILKDLYMDTCIELGRKVPFWNGNIQILNLSDKGLLFYVMGNRLEVQKTQLYVSSCARRAFAAISRKGHLITFEQMSQEYSNKEKD